MVNNEVSRAAHLVETYKMVFWGTLVASIICSTGMYFFIPYMAKQSGESVPGYAVPLGIIACMVSCIPVYFLWNNARNQLTEVKRAERIAEIEVKTAEPSETGAIDRSEIKRQALIIKAFMGFDLLAIATSIGGAWVAMNRIQAGEELTLNYCKVGMVTAVGIFFLWRLFRDRETLVRFGALELMDEFMDRKEDSRKP